MRASVINTPLSPLAVVVALPVKGAASCDDVNATALFVAVPIAAVLAFAGGEDTA